MKRIIIILLMFTGIAGEAIAQNRTIANSANKTNKHHNSSVIDSLRKVIKEQAIIIDQLRDEVIAQDRLLNTGYVKIATQKELQLSGVLTNKFLNKSSVNYSHVRPELFNPIDIRYKTEIEILSDSAKVLTPMPSNSYVIKKEKRHTLKLRILDINKFWGFTNYLIIQTY